MPLDAPSPPRIRASLSVRLLLLTLAFFMLSEVLILVPSVAMFRRDYLRMVLGEAHLAALALEATPNNVVSPDLAKKLLQRVGAHGIVLHRLWRMNAASDTPTESRAVIGEMVARVREVDAQFFDRFDVAPMENLPELEMTRETFDAATASEKFPDAGEASEKLLDAGGSLAPL